MESPVAELQKDHDPRHLLGLLAPWQCGPHRHSALYRAVLGLLWRGQQRGVDADIVPESRLWIQ